MSEKILEKINGYLAPQQLSLEQLAKLAPFPLGEANLNYAQYFDGESFLNPISTFGVPLFAVSFACGARNHWHLHQASLGGGQILIVTAGRGYYQLEGAEICALVPGDVVHIPANVLHWHGAAPSSALQHLALEVPGENCKTIWKEAVNPEVYAKLS